MNEEVCSWGRGEKPPPPAEPKFKCVDQRAQNCDTAFFWVNAEEEDLMAIDVVVVSDMEQSCKINRPFPVFFLYCCTVLTVTVTWYTWWCGGCVMVDSISFKCASVSVISAYFFCPIQLRFLHVNGAALQTPIPPPGDHVNVYPFCLCCIVAASRSPGARARDI